MIQRVEDEHERAEEAERVWEDTEKLARLLYHRRKEGPRCERNPPRDQAEPRS